VVDLKEESLITNGWAGVAGRNVLDCVLIGKGLQA
jgi:hypothetical protein